jgi:hypothetical protein
MNEKNQEISYLDLILLMAENIKLLILVPFFVALAVFCVGYFKPQNYTSEAIFSVTGPSSAIAVERMQSQLVLDKVVSSFPMFNGMPRKRAREQLADQIKFVIGKDMFLMLEVTTNNPEQSRNLLIAILEEWTRSDVFGIAGRADLEQRLAYAKTGLDAVNSAISTIKSSGKTASGNKLTPDAATSLSQSLSEMQIRYLSDLSITYKELQSVSHMDIKQAATLPTDANARGLGGLIVRIYFGVFAFLVLFLFVRKLWLNGGKNNEIAEKQTLIKIALGFK